MKILVVLTIIYVKLEKLGIELSCSKNKVTDFLAKHHSLKNELSESVTAKYVLINQAWKLAPIRHLEWLINYIFQICFLKIFLRSYYLYGSMKITQSEVKYIRQSVTTSANQSNHKTNSLMTHNVLSDSDIYKHHNVFLFIS